MDTRYKDWKLRNSSELWRPSTSKLSSASVKAMTAKPKDMQPGSNSEPPSQAVAKSQKGHPSKAATASDGAAVPSETSKPSVVSRLSPNLRRFARCKSTTASWNSCLSSGESTVQNTIEPRTLKASCSSPLSEVKESYEENESCEERTGEKAAEAQKLPPCNESACQSERAVLLPLGVSAVRDVEVIQAIHEPGVSIVRDVEVLQAGQESGVSAVRDVEILHVVEEPAVAVEVSSPRTLTHVHWQVNVEISRSSTPSESSPMSWKDSSSGVTSSVDSIVDSGRTQIQVEQSRDLQERKEPAGLGLFVQPLSKFIIGGPLHALASMTHLDLGKQARPQTPAVDLTQSVEQMSPIFEQPQNEDSESLSFNPEGLALQESLKSEVFETIEMQDPSSLSDGQCVLMRANMAFEPVPPSASKLSLRKKIKMKAPCPKQLIKPSMKKQSPAAGDGKSRSHTAGHGRKQAETKEEYTDDRCCITPVEAELGSPTSSSSKTTNELNVPSQDTDTSNTCVVTHSEHSIEVAELQDPPSRRRWPKGLASFKSSKAFDSKRSSTTSNSESQDETTPSADITLPVLVPGKCPGDAKPLRHVTVMGEEATSEKYVFLRASQNGEVQAQDPVSEPYTDHSNEKNVKDNFKRGLRICVPSDAVGEISFNPPERKHQQTNSNSSASQASQGEERELEPMSSPIQSHWENSSASQGNITHTSEVQADSTLENPDSQESSSHTPETSQCGQNNRHPEGGDQRIVRLVLPDRAGDRQTNESSPCSITLSSENSSSHQALKTQGNRGRQCRRAIPESTKFERGGWTSSNMHEESYPERASLSSEKLCSILSYLGHVEESNLQENYNLLQKTKPTCYSPTGTRSPRTVLEHDDSVSLADSTFTTTLTYMSNRSGPDSNANSGDGEANRNSAVSLFEGVRKKIQQYKDKLTGQETHNAELLRELEKVKEDKEQALSLEREKFGRELEIRAAEYKAAIQHHLSLNEKMIKDKETLSEKCCNLAGILSTAESKFEEKVKAMQEQAVHDLKKQKELWIVGEKPKREAWKEMKLKEIKEITVKGLEPHIEGIVEKHKQELQKVETRHADDTQKKLEIQAIQQRQEMCHLRERLLKDRDDLLEKERMAALKRMNEVAEKYEQQAMQLRMRVSGDMATELERVEESRRRDKHDAHELLSKMQKEAAEREDALRMSLERAMQDAISKREAEIGLLRAEMAHERNERQKLLDEHLQKELEVKERELHTRLTQERDEQIDMIIERMEVEKDEAIAQHQQDLLSKVERLMEEKLDFMKRMKEVESKCASLCQLSLEAKQKAETELENRDVQVASLERELSCQSDFIEQLKTQINEEKNVLKQQEEHFEHRIQKEQGLLQSALMDIERSHAQTQQMRLKKVEELAEVEAHVRQAIDNKDLVIAGLREQLLSAREQIRHTELLLSG